jgi:hypothetical protein
MKAYDVNLSLPPTAKGALHASQMRTLVGEASIANRAVAESWTVEVTEQAVADFKRAQGISGAGGRKPLPLAVKAMAAVERSLGQMDEPAAHKEFSDKARGQLVAALEKTDRRVAAWAAALGWAGLGVVTSLLCGVGAQRRGRCALQSELGPPRPIRGTHGPGRRLIRSAVDLSLFWARLQLRGHENDARKPGPLPVLSGQQVLHSRAMSPLALAHWAKSRLPGAGRAAAMMRPPLWSLTQPHTPTLPQRSNPRTIAWQTRLESTICGAKWAVQMSEMRRTRWPKARQTQRRAAVQPA